MVLFVQGNSNTRLVASGEHNNHIGAMSTSQYGVLFLFLLINNKALVLADTTACPDNTIIQNQLSNMMTVILAMNSTLKEQAENMEEMKTNIDQVLVATNLTSTQLNQHLSDQLVHDDRLKLINELSSSTDQLVESTYGAELGPRDCSDIRKMGFTNSRVYRVYPGSDDRRVEADVYCDLNSLTSWLVFQRRMDGSVNFERVYSDYERGFGNLTGEFWLGNEMLSLLTKNRRYKLRIELEDFASEKRYAEYLNFTVAPETDNYRLTVGGYTGSGHAGDSMDVHNGMQFTTSDVDNDAWFGNCAITYHGAWWYNGCHLSNLNGLYLHGNHSSYGDGVEWYTWLGYYYSLKTTEMKIAAY